jgi:hypothetical protein
MFAILQHLRQHQENRAKEKHRSIFVKTFAEATALHLQRDPTQSFGIDKPAVDSLTVRILDRFLHLHHFSARHVEVSSPYHGTDQQVLAGAVHHVRHLGPHAQEARCVGFVPSCTVVSYSHGLTTPARLMQCLRWTTLSHKKSSSAPSASASWNRSRTRYRALLSAKVTPHVRTHCSLLVQLKSGVCGEFFFLYGFSPISPCWILVFLCAGSNGLLLVSTAPWMRVAIW